MSSSTQVPPVEPPERTRPAQVLQPVAGPKVTSPAQASPSGETGRRLSRLAPFLAAGFFALALWGVHHALTGVSYGTVWQAILSVPPGQIALAFAGTVLGYVALTGYDVLALRYVRHPLGYPRTGLASFVAFAFSNSVGLAMLTGASVRARLYSQWGLTTPVIGRIIGFSAVTLWTGVLGVAGVAMVLEPATIAPMFRVPTALVLAGGLMMLLIVGLYLAWCGVWRRPLRVRGWTFTPPTLAIGLGQLAVSALDWMAAAGVLYALLPVGSGPAFPAFAGVFVVAQALGLASHVPGGVGVFEGSMLLLAGQSLPVSTLAGALIAFRAIYYLLPLLAATVLLAGGEALRHRERLGQASRALGRIVPAFAAPVLAIGVFATGTILLLSGATPTVGWRLELLRDLVPLPLLEASHFIASLVGAGLILIAYGLYRRINAAWLFTTALLAAGVVTSLLKGLDFEEASVAAVALAAILPARARFYRRSSLLDEPWTAGWIMAVVVTLSTSIWLGLFAYRHVEYSADLWWQFEFGADAPRFLRATVGAISVALLLAIVRLLRPARRPVSRPSPEELQRAEAILAVHPQAHANLALLGDKSLLFNDARTAFLMYAVRGRSWVAMGDPVGNDQEVLELTWRFREMVDQHGGWPVFYEVSRHRLPLYLEQGLTLLKLGEEARVSLPSFTLEGGSRASLRRWRNAVERAGCSVEILPVGASDALLPDIERISNDWLAARNTREKRFSLGSFSPEYLRHFPIALVRQEGRPVAFATLWTTGTRAELMVDLMRYVSDAPPNVMTYLFIHIMLWGREHGYQWFNFGMAPLAGLQPRALAPLWTRLGAFVFRHGEDFYNFRGLREYKDRFDPVWEPRYLASPGGLALPFILTDIASLIGGGLKGVFAK
jgi:phosphatidylglycerol lysyltransferase